MSAPGRSAALLAAGLLAFLSGCAVEPAATSTTAEPDLTVSMFEWGFGPSTIAVVEGSTVILSLRNEGRLRHDWVIVSTPIETEADLGSREVLVSSAIEPGAVDVVEFPAPAAGRYQIICSIAGHFSQGMEGSLIVTP